MNEAYQAFLESKIEVAPVSGFDVDPDTLNPALLPHQRDAVAWALHGGRRALFESFGLGKTVQEIEFCHQVLLKNGGKALIVLPLGVRQEFTHDAVEILGYEAPKYITHIQEAKDAPDGALLMTNYERVRDGDIDPKYFSCCVLDEAAVLRSFGSKTFQTFLPKFKGVKYKLVATATPAPNRLKELIHYSGFLEVMDSGQALTRFFQRDSTKANNLTLYPHKVEEFWTWVSTWALYISKPSDLGYDDTGYDLPPMEVRVHVISDDYGDNTDKDGQYKLINDTTASLQEASREKKQSILSRCVKAKEIVDESPNDNFLLWHDREEERHVLKKLMPEIVDIYGTMDYDERERRVEDFSFGRTRLFATKKSLSGVGCNFQRYCHRAIFVGIDYQFHDFIQACHRIYRFLQTEKVVIDIIYTEAEEPIYKAMMEKWKLHEEQQERMRDIVKKYGLDGKVQIEKLRRSIGVKRVEIKGKRFTAINNDCVDETAKMPDNSVDMILTSIPFCYDEETEVLTENGWMKFPELTGKERIATYSESVKSVEYQLPSAIVNEPYRGEMIEFSGRAFNLCVTPNHRMYAARRGKAENYQIATADEITKSYENASRKAGSTTDRISRGWKLQVVPEGAICGKRPERIDIPKLPENVKHGHGVELYWVETEDFMRLAGWYLAEGHADDFVKKVGGRLIIGQSPVVNPENYAEIVSLFQRIGLPPTESKNQITVWCRNLAYFLQSEFGHGAENKRIPRWVFELDGSLLTILRDTMMKGDGSKDGTSYASISKKLRDDFQELCVLTGWRAIIPKADGKWIYTGKKEIRPEIRHTPIRYQYDGRVGCVTVPNGLIIVRRNGFTCISGNSNHYEYTPSYNDFGHNEDTDRFFEQMDFLSPNLLRVLKPGRVFACHVKDRVLFGNATGTGMPTMEPFHAICIQHYMKHGFQYFGMITVVTDVVRENNQTYRLGWTEQCKDGSKMGVGCPEYILLFRKLPTDTSTAYADEPVTKTKEDYTRAQWQLDAHAFWRDSGDRLLTKEELMNCPVDRLQSAYRKYSRNTVYSYEEHLEMCKKLDADGHLPATFMVMAPGSWSEDVWDDIVRMRTLNSEQKRRDLQLHVCLAEGSLILTRRGFVPIEQIEVGDQVLTHLGKWKPVIAAACTGEKETVQTKAKGVPNLITTSDHKLWTRTTSSNPSRPKDAMRKAEPEWVEAKDTVGSYVNLKLPPVEESALTDQEWWIVGRYLADGHVGTRGDFFISVGKEKKDAFETMASGFIGTVADHDALQYRLKNLRPEMISIFQKCGRGAKNKQVPIEGICAKSEQAECLLSGYLSGDGNRTGNATSATSVSRALLLGMAMVAQRARGVIPSVYHGKPERMSTILGRTVHCNQEWVMSWRDPVGHIESIILDDGAWKKVKASTPVGKRKVYSIQVEDDASYTAEGCIVKNCPLQFGIVDRLINRYTNEDDLVFDPFGGIGTVPLRALKLGRRGIMTELNADYFRDAVGYLESEEERIDTPTLFDLIGENDGD